MIPGNNFYRVSIKALVLDKNKKFLLIWEDTNLWELPGGGLNFGEEPHECLTRELKEEMNIIPAHINKYPSYFVTALKTDGTWKSNVIYETVFKDLKFTPSDECLKIKFFTKEEALKENLFPGVKEFIAEYNPDNHEPKTNIV